MKRIALLLATLCLPLSSQALYTIAETAEVIPPGQYRAYVEPQLFLSDGSGMNLMGHFDAGISDASSIRISMGVGSTDFHTGFSYKWVPYPDFGDQPAIGFKIGAELGRDNDNTIVLARFTPLISKKFERPEGLFIPYLSLPIGVASIGDESYLPLHIVGGTEFKPEQLRNIRFGGELGLELNDSFSYFSAYVSLDIDGDAGIRFE